MLDRSARSAPSSTTWLDLAAGWASPVRVDSSVFNPAADSTRASAGTMSPASTAITSPGTRSAAGICTRPARLIRRAVSAVIPRSASIALAARISVAVSSTATAATTAAITTASDSSPNTPDSTATAISSSCNGSVSDSASSAGHRLGLRLRTALAPYRARRATRSRWANPWPVASSRASTSPVSRACQLACAPVGVCESAVTADPSRDPHRGAARPPPADRRAPQTLPRSPWSRLRLPIAGHQPQPPALINAVLGRIHPGRGLHGQRRLLKRGQRPFTGRHRVAGRRAAGGAEVVPGGDLAQPGLEPVQVGLGLLHLGVGGAPAPGLHVNLRQQRRGTPDHLAVFDVAGRVELRDQRVVLGLVGQLHDQRAGRTALGTHPGHQPTRRCARGRHRDHDKPLHTNPPDPRLM